MCSDRTRRDIADLSWHECGIVLECRELHAGSYKGHAFEVMNALLHGVPRRRGQCIAFHSPDIPLARRRLHVGARVDLRLAMTGFDNQSAAEWAARFIEHVDGRRESHFAVHDVRMPHEAGLATLRWPSTSEEWRLDFDTPLPFSASEREGRTLLRAHQFWQLLHRRMERLFDATLRPRIDPRCFVLLGCFWHYEEFRHRSFSQNRGKGRNDGEHAHHEYFNGCAGPVFLRGELEPLRPWVALAQALHAGGLLELNPLGHFTVTDRAEPYLDHRLGNVAAIARVAEIVLAHTDAALTHARSHQGHADPRLLADELAADLVAAGYEPEPYEVFQVPKDSGGTRTLERLAPRDLVAQQYVNNLLAPVFDRAFSPASMAYRRGVSRESAAAKVRELIAEGNRFAVRTDVEAFFPSIDHARLMAELDRLLPMGDVQLRRMLQRVVVAPYRRDGAVQVRARGLAQGSPLSPLLANVLLDVLDRHMADAHIGFVRYADDMVLLARSRETAELALESARDALDEMGLCLSAEKTTPVLPVEQGFDFLGEHFDASTMDVHVNVLLPQRRPLLVTEPYLTLAVNGDAVDLRRDRALVATIPFRMVSEIVVVTKANFSTALIEKCAYHGIPLCVGLHTGTRSATMAPDTRACRETGWLQGQRYHALSERERTAVAADFAVAKILNYLPLVRDRFRGGDAALLHELESDAHEACHARDNNAIRGHEGIAARRLFSFVNREISKPFRTGFRSRRRDTKGSDRLNSMLNFGYHLLMTRLSGLIRGCGLNPYWAYLHETTDNYETLVYDVMEPFRVHVDRLVLRLINRRQIGECDFSLSGNSMRMTHDAVKTFAQEFEKLMGEVHGNLTINDSLLLQVENLKDFAVEGRPLLVYRWKPAQTSADNHQ